jgi:hypothetical protein
VGARAGRQRGMRGRARCSWNSGCQRLVICPRSRGGLGSSAGVWRRTGSGCGPIAWTFRLGLLPAEVACRLSETDSLLANRTHAR